jgi:hypothetical protein
MAAQTLLIAIGKGAGGCGHGHPSKSQNDGGNRPADCACHE